MKSSAIDSEKLNALKNELIEYVEKIHIILNNIDNEVDIIKSSVSDDIQDLVISKYSEIRRNYSNIEKNIKTYSCDIANIIKVYQNQDKELAAKIISDINKINF